MLMSPDRTLYEVGNGRQRQTTVDHEVVAVHMCVGVLHCGREERSGLP